MSARKGIASVVAIIVLRVQLTLMEQHTPLECSAYPSTHPDLNTWTNTHFTFTQVRELLAATDQRCRGKFASDCGLSLVRIRHGQAGEVIMGWGKHYHSWTHLAERILLRLTNSRAGGIGRPDTLKTLTEYTGYNTLGKTIYLLVNDRKCDLPIVFAPGCKVPQYQLPPIPHALPVLSVAKIPQCSKDILIPFRDLFEHVNPSRKPSNWNDKINAAVWRGSMTGYPTAGDTPRELLMRAAGRNDTDMPPGEYMTQHNQLRYRVLLDADGNAYSKRLKWYFHGGGSAVLHGGYYDDVLLRSAVPGIHYERFEMTNKSLQSKLDLLLGNTEHARLIAHGGRRFGKQYIRPERWRCYMHELVRLYAHANITFA